MNNNFSRWILGTRGFYDNYSIKIKIPNTDYSFFLNHSLISPYDLYDPHLKVWALLQDKKKPRNNIALEEVFPMKAGSFSNEMFFVKIGNNILKENKVKGELKNSDNSIIWNLTFDIEKDSSVYPLEYLYRSKHLKNKISTPGFSIYFSGKIIIDNKEYFLDKIKGLQTHNWGNKMPENWNWGHCNNFDDNSNTMFEAYLFKRKLPLNFSTPDIGLYHLFYKGKDYYFNNPISIILTQNDYHIGYWKFKTENKDLKIIGSFEVEYKDFVAIRSNDTNHDDIFSHSTMFGKLTIDIYKKEGWIFKKIDTIKTKNNATVEFAYRYKDPHVELLIE